MLRTINDVFNQVLEAKDRIKELHLEILNEVLADPALAGLNSTSKTAIYRLWAFIFAVMAWIQEKQFEEHQAAVNELAEASWYGTTPWWLKKAKAFQYGDVLEIINDVPAYAVELPESDPKRIIKFSAITETMFGGALLKVAQASGDTFTKLSQPQKDSFIEYVKRFQAPGSNVSIVSEEPDEVRVFGTVYFDGQYDPVILKALANSAAHEFRKEGLTETGEIVKNDLQDKIKHIPGVKDFVITNLEARPANGAWASVSRKYLTTSGYFVFALNPSSSLEFSPEY